MSRHIGKGLLNSGRNMKNVSLFVTMTEMFFQHPLDSQFHKAYTFGWSGDTWWVDILWKWLEKNALDQWQCEGSGRKERWGPVNHGIYVWLFNIRMGLAKRWGWVRMSFSYSDTCELTFQNSEACVFFKAGKNRDRYFDADDLLQQVDNAIDIFEAKTNRFATGLFLFDNTLSHQRRALDALSAWKMPKNPHAMLKRGLKSSRFL